MFTEQRDHLSQSDQSFLSGPEVPNAFPLSIWQSDAAQRRELWRESQQQSVEDHGESSSVNNPYVEFQPQTHSFLSQPHSLTLPSSDNVFSFDSFDRESYRSQVHECQSHFHYNPFRMSSRLLNSHDEDVFAPTNNPPEENNPQITFSSLQIKDSIEEEDETGIISPRY